MYHAGDTKETFKILIAELEASTLLESSGRKRKDNIAYYMLNEGQVVLTGT
jgi:hypothetical protein